MSLVANFTKQGDIYVVNKLRQDINIGVNIRKMRQQNNLTQEAVALKLQIMGYGEVTRSLYSRYETGELNLKVSHLRALKEIFRCSYDDLLDGSK